MIQLFNINHHKIDTSEFSNMLHDDVVIQFEKKIAEYVGAKYACAINSATNAIFLTFTMDYFCIINVDYFFLLQRLKY